MSKLLILVADYFAEDYDDTLWQWLYSTPYCMTCYSLNDSL